MVFPRITDNKRVAGYRRKARLSVRAALSAARTGLKNRMKAKEMGEK